MKSSLAVTLLLQSSVASKKSKCPFGYTSEDSKLLQTEDDLEKYLYPKQMPGFDGTEGHIKVRTGAKKDNLYKLITEAVWKAHDDLPSTGKDRQNFIGCLLRTTGHDFMDFRYVADDDGNFVKATGGADGCINFKDPDNKGIPQCLTNFKVADIYKDFKDYTSLADFFVVMAEAIAARAATAWNNGANKWGPNSLEERFRSQFQFGRKTSHDCTDANGMMPNPEEGCADLKRIFLDHIYLNADLDTPWRRLTAISGVHTIGSMKKENSGYVGDWTTTPSIFNNEYYILMVNKGWGPRRNIEKNKKKNAWEIIDLSARDPTNEVFKEHDWTNILYLNTDMCLAYNNNFDTMAIKPMYQKFKQKEGEAPKPGVPQLANPLVVWSSEDRKQLVRRGNLLNAKNRNCCAWFSEKDLFKNPKENYNEGNTLAWKNNWKKFDYCGHKVTYKDYLKAKYNQDQIKEDCCGGLDGWAETGNTWEDTQPLNCEYHGDVRGPAIEHVMKYANDEKAWLTDYLEAWKVATNNVIDFTQDQTAAKEYFDKHYDHFYGLEDEEHVECEGKNDINCRKHIEVKKWGKWTGESTGYKIKGYRNFYDKQNKDFVEESRSIWESNEGYKEHICLMRENTYDPQFWVDRGNHEGHTCYGLQFTGLRAPYDNVAALERTKHFKDMDPNWEQLLTDEIGVGVTKVPTGEAARRYYGEWAIKDQQWRDKWENMVYPPEEEK